MYTALLLGALTAPAGAGDELAPWRSDRPVTFGAIVVPEIYAVDVMAPMPVVEGAWIGMPEWDVARFDHVVGLGPWPVRVCCQTEANCDGAACFTACTEGSSACCETKAACCENPSGCTVACQTASCDESATAGKCTRGECCRSAKPQGVTITAMPVFEGARWFRASTEGSSACEKKTACCENSENCAVACQTASCDESACATKCASGNCCRGAKNQAVAIAIPPCPAPSEASACFTISCSTEGCEGEEGCPAGRTAKCFTSPLFGGNARIIIQRQDAELTPAACSTVASCEGNTACCENKAACCEVACQTAACDESACATKCASGNCCRAKQQAIAIAVPACPTQGPVTHAVLSDCGSPDAAMTDVRAVLAAQIEAIESNAACATACMPAVAAPAPDSVPAIGTLRQAAQVLEQAACQLEEQSLYARADQLRGLAAELRHDARGDRHPPMTGVNVQVITPMAAPNSLPHELDRLHEQLQRVRKALAPHREPRLH